MVQTTDGVNAERSSGARLGGPLAWLIWSLSALAFGYAFFMRVSPSVMVDELMRDFAVSGAILGQLSALYFYPYALLQLPLGALLDRFGARLLLSVSLSAATVGAVVFGWSTSIEMAYAGRFLIGAGSAAGFISSLALAAAWFPAHRFAFLAGSSMMFAMLCGMAGQGPLAMLVDGYGWRSVMAGSGIFAGLLALVIFLVVRNAPVTDDDGAGRAPKESWGQVWQGIKLALSNSQVWRVALVACAMSGPMLALAGLWGTPYLMQAFDLPRPEAAFYSSLLLFGWALGAPVLGWLSDAIRYRKWPLVLASGVMTGLLAMLAFVPGLSQVAVVGVMAATGVFAAAMAICFALVREVTDRKIHGAATGVVNGMTVGSGAVLQPVIGWLLDRRWDGTLVDGVRVYGASDYQFAFSSLVVWAAIGFLVTLTLTETRAVSQFSSK